MIDPAHAAIEVALRDQWGRLLALLVAQFRRLDLAEDALADAFESAARTWPDGVIPTNPAAWLLTAARNRVTDRLRSEAVLARTMPQLATDEVWTPPAPDEISDERLRLVLLCAHPALSPEAAAALTLRLVVGVSTADIAAVFLQSKATMAARLTRAKRRLAGASFDLPDDVGDRIATARQIAYLAFTAGYAPPSGADLVRSDVAADAIRLARAIADLTPSDPETDALLALMLLQHSRRRARYDAQGLVLLGDQDRRLWDHDQIAESLELLAPLVHAPPSPFLLQALIAAEHAIAPRPEDTCWERIVERYDELLELGDSAVIRLNRAVALAERDGPAAGLAALESVALPGHRLPAVRAELLVRLGRHDQARASYDQAIALCDNDAEREHLIRRASAGG